MPVVDHTTALATVEWVLAIRLASIDAHPADLLRLIVVPVLAWSAYEDVRTRRFPHEWVWYPVLAIGIGLLLWPGSNASLFTADRATLAAMAASICLVVPLAYGWWAYGSLGRGDVIVLVVIAVVVPIVPTFTVGSLSFPLRGPDPGAGAFVVLVNAVVVLVPYSLWLAVRNYRDGVGSVEMFRSRRIDRERLEGSHGILCVERGGSVERVLDLDVLRMYLRWRGLSLAELLDDPDRFRDPGTLPARPNDPTDGTVGLALQRQQQGGFEPVDPDDAWGAQHFLDAVEDVVLALEADDLRSGLGELVARERPVVTPYLPMLVPLLAGVVLMLLVGQVTGPRSLADLPVIGSELAASVG